MGLMLLSVFFTSFVQASDITADMVIKLTNKAREKAGVAVLVKNDLLQKAAEQKAQDMIDKDYFAHVSPQGKSPWDWIQGVGYDYQYAGENLAINFTNAEDEQEAWMKSPLHQKNILNSNYEEIGVAVEQGVINGQKTILTVQEFGAKMPETVAVTSILDEKKSKKEVAGITVSAPKQQVESLQKISNKLDLNSLFQQNKPTVVGWFGIFAIVLVVMGIDVAAVFHKKHKQLLILHDARKRQA